MARKGSTKKTFGAFQLRYVLETYKGPSSRHTCPRCGGRNEFSKYVDVTTLEHVGNEYGMCNNLVKCGYHEVPPIKGAKMLDNMVHKDDVHVSLKIKKDFISLVPHDELTFMRTLPVDNLSKFLFRNFDPSVVHEVLTRYNVTPHYQWDGATCFWQVDTDSDLRTGKIILYDEVDGKRVKVPYAHTSWVHTPFAKDLEPNYIDFNLEQVFFGTHLLPTSFDKVVNIVESEKTALICSIMRPDSLWLATGGLQMIGGNRMNPLAGRKLVFYPDKGASYHLWVDKLKKNYGSFDYTVSDFLESKNLPEGADMADYILYKKIN